MIAVNNIYNSLGIAILTLGIYHFPTVCYSSIDPDNESLVDMSLNQLMELEVFSAATRLPVQYSKAPGSVYKFNRGDFKRFGIRRIDELLQYVPGIQLNQYRKRHRSIWARGVLDRYNDKLVLVVDGTQRRNLYYSHFSLGDDYPIENIEAVEIIVGPASSLYGANAFAGLISITTRSFSHQAKTELSAEVGNNHHTKVSAMYSGSKLQGFISYLDHEAGYAEDRRSFIGLDSQQPTDEYYANLQIKAELIKDMLFTLAYQKNNTPYLFIPDTQRAYIDTRSLTTSLQYQIGDLSDGLYQFKAYYTQDRIEEYELEEKTRRTAYEEQQDGNMAGVSLMISKNATAQQLFSMGISWEYDHAKNFDFTRYWHFRDGFYKTPHSASLLSDPNIENNNFALFFQDIWTIHEQLDLTLGGRYDYYDTFGEHFNYRAALVYTPNNSQVFKLLYGTATRTPTYREYLKVLDSNFVATTPDPEEMKTIELAYSHTWKNINLSATLYRNKFEKYIQEVQTPDNRDEYFANSSDE